MTEKNVGKAVIGKSSSMDDYIENILAENLTLKRKLDSKCEAILILNSEVGRLKNDKEQMKDLFEKIKVKEINLVSEPDVHHTDITRGLRLEVETLRQKLRDALGDIQVLRSKISNKQFRTNKTDEDKKLLEGEEVVKQLEELQYSKMQLQADLQSVLDEKEELIVERDAYKCKLHRLNHECNVLLQGNTNAIIDLDALIMENRLLQERLIHSQEECQLAKQVSQRYKNMLQTQKSKGAPCSSNSENSSMLLSQKQVKELLASCGTTQVPGPDASISDLRSLCLALLDSLGDKTLALSHQKRANRILAARIAELQARLETSHAKKAVESPSTALLEGYKSIVESPTKNPIQE